MVSTKTLASIAGAVIVGAAPSAHAESANPAMWRAADADTEVVFLGTFHILPKGVDWRTPAFEVALTRADTVYFEVDSGAPDAQSKTLSVLMTQGFNADGGLLSDMLDESDTSALRGIVNSLGLPFDGVNPMRPWNAFLTLSVQFIVQQGFDPGSGVDSVLLAEARTKNKDVRFFETIDEQLGFFTGLDAATEKALLLMTIRDWAEQTESFDDLFAAWKNGDVAYIDSEMNRTMRAEAPVVFDRLLVERNEKWADEIARVMDEETGTILVGDQSVPAMLGERGLAVERYGAIETAPANDNAPASDEDEIGSILESVGDE
jgi:uncharacterized protein YbaP (TraB family)